MNLHLLRKISNSILQKQEKNFSKLKNKQTIKVQIFENRFGHILVVPINKKYSKMSFYIQVDN